MLPLRESTNLGVVFSEIINTALPPVRDYNDQVDGRFERVITRAVRKEVSERCQDAAEPSSALLEVQAKDMPLVTRSRLMRIVARDLPYPIASAVESLERADGETDRVNRLVDVVHTVIQFLATVAIADRISAKNEPPFPAGMTAETFARPSLGHWLSILRGGARSGPEPLIPECRSLMLKPGGGATSAALLLAEFVELRNNVKHGASQAVGLARRTCEEHRPKLDDLLANLLFLRSYQLFVARGLDYVDGTFRCDAQLLRGAGSPPARTWLTVPQPVTTGQVYLMDCDCTRIVSLHPLLIVGTCPQYDDEEMFWYESAGDRRAHFFSFEKGHSLASEHHMEQFVESGLVGRSDPHSGHDE